MANMFAAFAGAGILQGLGDGMVHERNLQESLDTNYKLQQQKLNYDEQLAKAKSDDAAEEQIRVKNRNINNNSSIKDYQTLKGVTNNISSGMQSGDFTGQAAQNQSAPTPGVPQGMDNSMPAPRTAAMPQAQAQPAPAQPIPQQGAGLNSPQGSPVNFTPPPKEDIPPTSPAAAVMGQADAEHTNATQDPYDIAFNKFSTRPNGFSQNIHDDLQGWHDSYPNLTPEQITSQADMFYSGKSFDGDGAKFEAHLQKMDAAAAKNGVIPPNQMGTVENNSLHILKNEGLMGDNAQLKPLTNAQIKDNDTLVQQAYQTKSAAQGGLDTFARIVGDVAKTNPGPGQSSEMWLESAWGKMTNSQRTEALTKFYENQKNSTQALNAQINIMRQMGGRFIVGQKVLELEKGAIPDLNAMSPQASLDMAQTYINGFKQASNAADAIVKGGEHLSPQQRLALADTYAEKNPAAGIDGLTPNPNFKEFTEFNLSKGASTGGITGADKRASVTQDAAGATADVKAGGQGKVPEHTDQFIQKIAPTLPAGWTIKKN